jgi:hypothetical protein
MLNPIVLPSTQATLRPHALKEALGRLTNLLSELWPTNNKKINEGKD